MKIKYLKEMCTQNIGLCKLNSNNTSSPVCVSMCMHLKGKEAHGKDINHEKNAN